MIETMSNSLTIQYVADALNHFWEAQKTCIIAADNSDCQNDPRGPSELKFCSNNNSMVYYILPQEALTLKSWTHSDTNSSVQAHNAAKNDYESVRRESG